MVPFFTSSFRGLFAIISWVTFPLFIVSGFFVVGQVAAAGNEAQFWMAAGGLAIGLILFILVFGSVAVFLQMADDVHAIRDAVCAEPEELVMGPSGEYMKASRNTLK